MKLSSKQYILLGFALILLWQILGIFQGLDLADTGFHLSAFRFIIEDPYSVQYSMSFWLSDICGHLWMSIWPNGGLLWARIGAIFFTTLCITVYYKILHEQLGTKATVSGLVFTSIIIVRGGFECLHYDLFSMLGFGISIYFLQVGLTQKHSWRLYLAGLVFGITVFFKLTNLAGLLLFLAIPFYALIQKEKLRFFLLKCLHTIGGVLSGITLILLLIKSIGHWELFFNNFSFISQMSTDSEASHGLIPMLLSYAKGFTISFLLAALFILALWLVLKSKMLQQSLKNKKARFALTALTVIASVVFMIWLKDPFWSKIRYLLIGLLLIAGIQSSLRKSESAQVRLLSFLGILLLIVTPIGSDSGINKTLFGFWIMAPIFFSSFSEYFFRPLRIELPDTASKSIRSIIVALCVTCFVLYAWQHTYFDTGSRIHKTASIKHPLLKGIHTSKERAETMNELIEDAFPLITENYLLSFIEIPMLNYLCDTKPFISTSWPKLYYSPDAFQSKLIEALSIRKDYPAILRQKQNTKLEVWPQANAPINYLQYPKDIADWPKHGKIISTFIIENEYTVIWENEMFQLLKTEK